MQSLELNKVGMIGWGTGANYALGCAYKIPHLLDFVVCMSCFYEFMLQKSLRKSFTSCLLNYIGIAPKTIMNLFKLSLPNVDQIIFKDTKINDIALLNITTCTLGPFKGHSTDFKISLQPYKFHVNDIEMPVYFYHGGDDKLTSVKKIKKLVELMPFAQLHIFENESIFYPTVAYFQNIIFDHISAVLLTHQELKKILNP